MLSPNLQLAEASFCMAAGALFSLYGSGATALRSGRDASPCADSSCPFHGSPRAATRARVFLRVLERWGAN